MPRESGALLLHRSGYIFCEYSNTPGKPGRGTSGVERRVLFCGFRHLRGHLRGVEALARRSSYGKPSHSFGHPWCDFKQTLKTNIKNPEACQPWTPCTSTTVDPPLGGFKRLISMVRPAGCVCVPWTLAMQRRSLGTRVLLVFAQCRGSRGNAGSPRCAHWW